MYLEVKKTNMCLTKQEEIDKCANYVTFTMENEICICKITEFC